MERPPPGTGRAPRFALAALVLVAFAVLAALALAVPAPRLLSDEVRYTIAAGSLAEGNGLRLRDADYGFGPVYPGILAAILAVVPEREAAYPLLKLVNALLFALAAVPVYLVARRLLAHRWSLAVAALSVAIPSSTYVSLAMTESAAYAVACVAVLAIVLALERPSPARQLAVIAATVLAYLTRAQFVVLFPAFVAALVLLAAVVPTRRPRRLRELGPLWPTWGALVVGLLLAAGVPLASGRSPIGLPSAYDELWAGYDPGAVARLVVYHLGALELYLAVVPLAVSPIVLSRLVRSARAGSAEAGAFLSAFLALNASFVLVAAAFASTPAGLGHLHDRYLFYVVPLWLVVLALWLRDGLPRPALAATLGAVLALALPAATPFERLAAEGEEAGAIVTYFWSSINAFVFDTFPDEISGRRVLALFVVAFVLAALVVPRRLGLALGAAVAAGILLGTAISWRDSARAAGDFEAILPHDRAWVDDAVGTDGDVTSLYVSGPCGRAPWSGLALLLTEFYNRSVDRAAHVGAEDGSLLPSTALGVRADGTLVEASGAALEASTVVAADGIDLRGRRLARGTSVPLVLWEVESPVRVVGARSAPDVERAACRSG